MSQAYAKSKLTVQELAKYATDAAAEYTGSARQAAEEVWICTALSNASYLTAGVIIYLKFSRYLQVSVGKALTVSIYSSCIGQSSLRDCTLTSTSPIR